VKEKGYRTEKDRFRIDLSDWNPKIVFIRLPQLEYNYSTHGKEVAQLIETYVKKDIGEKDLTDPNIVLQQLFELVNSKLNVNLAYLETIIYAYSVYGLEDRDYDMARFSPHPSLATRVGLFQNRSLSAMFAFEDLVGKMLKNPNSYIKSTRPDHPFDVIMDPEGVLKYLNKH
jgi:hypothetical protein